MRLLVYALFVVGLFGCAAAPLPPQPLAVEEPPDLTVEQQLQLLIAELQPALPEAKELTPQQVQAFFDRLQG